MTLAWFKPLYRRVILIAHHRRLVRLGMALQPGPVLGLITAGGAGLCGLDLLHQLRQGAGQDRSMMPNLRVRPAAPGGHVHHVTPETAGWTYVGFDLLKLRTPATCSRAACADREVCLVLVSGKAPRSTVDGVDLGELGERMSPFEGPALFGLRAGGRQLAGRRRPPRSNWRSARRPAARRRIRRGSSRRTTSRG